MKRTFGFLGILMMACQLRADPSVNWVSDSYGSFDVVLTGTGPGWSGTITSPSGLWQMYSGNIIQDPFPSNNPNLPPVMLGNSGTVTYMGVLPSQLPAPDISSPIHSVSIGTAGGYMQFFDPSAPLNAGSPMNYGYLSELSFYGSFQDWAGMSTLSITSIPNPNDVSTWTWAAEYKASGESLRMITPVPEPSTVSLVTLAIVFGIASIYYKRRKSNQLQAVRIKSNQHRA
jgi:hypothetical protein